MNVSHSSLRRSLLFTLARHPAYRRKPSNWAPSLEALEVRLVLSTTWLQQGSGPIINGQDEGITSVQGNNPVSGAISDIAVGATADIIYAATVNGGVWKTINATAATPTWVPLTDNASLAQAGQFPSLSLSSIALSPLNASTLFAGAGRTSSFGSDGGDRFGIARSTDGGSTWAVFGPINVDVRSLSATRATVGGNEVILAGTSGGVYRSTDGGSTYSQITVGIPAGDVTDLVNDQGVATRFYAAVNGSIYLSNDTGATWTITNAAGLLSSVGSRVLLSASQIGAADDLYAMVIDASVFTRGVLSNVYRSSDQGTTFTALGVPVPVIFPGRQGRIHGAIVADATDPTAVWISGDRQNTPFPNANGASDYSANIFQYTGGSWQNRVDNGANGTSPHADSRRLAYDAAGSLIYLSDGGVFALNNPSSSTRKWSSLNGTILPTEAHSAAFDPVSSIYFSGNQDTGTSVQTTTGGTTWNDLISGDGGDVQVDADQTAHPGTSIRYVGFTGLAAYRVTFNASNTQTSGFVPIAYNIINGLGTGQTINQFDPNVQFYNPYVLNRVNPARMLIGTASIYESLDKGNTVANLGFTSAFIGGNFGNNPLTYGGLNGDGSSNPGSFYVGSGSRIFHRSADGGPIPSLATYPGGTVRAIVSDPKNVAHVFVADSNSNVWGSFNEGATWINLTANVGTLTNSIRSIEIFSPSSSPLNTVLLVGGVDGVFQMRRPGASGASWTPVATGLPKGVLVTDLRYEYTQNVLTIGTIGRGVWSLTNFFRGGGGTGIPGVARAPSGAGGPGGGTGVLNVPSQPPIAMPVSHSMPQDPNPSQNTFKATGDQLTFIGIPAVSTQAVSAYATDDISSPVSSVSAVVDGPAGLFTTRRTRKPVAQSQGDMIKPFGSSLLN